MMSQNTIIFIPVLPWLEPLLLYCKFGLWQLFFFFCWSTRQRCSTGSSSSACFYLSCPSFFHSASSFVPHYPSINPSSILEGAWRVFFLSSCGSSRAPVWTPAVPYAALRRHLLLCVREGSAWHKSHWVLFGLSFTYKQHQRMANGFLGP